MYKRILVLALLSLSTAYDLTYRCSNSTENILTFAPASDGVNGRYTVEWCSPWRKNNDSYWDLTVYYYRYRSEKKCKHFNASVPSGERHSHIEIQANFNCTNVCVSTYQDLIFNGTCYHIKSGLKIKNTVININDSLFYIENQFPQKYFTESRTQVSYEKLQDKEYIVWHTGNIPVTNYNIRLCNETGMSCKNVEANCTTETPPYEINCPIYVAPGNYDVYLQHNAPWVGDVFRNLITSKYPIRVGNETIRSDVNVGEEGINPLVWGGVGVGVGVAALLVLLGSRKARTVALRQRVRQDWRSRQMDVQPKIIETGSRVLLIYARDCPQFTRAVQILATALRRTGNQVIDIFSSEAVAASANAPGEWVRRLAADPATRLLLLQSPAAAALYAPQLRPSATLSAPLLGRAAVRRVPHPADGIAMIALRLLGEAAHRPLAYRKCYVASINGLNCELVPGVTPQRRYVIPAYADVLLRDLAPEQASPTEPGLTGTADPLGHDCADLLQDLARALEEMCEYVRANPNYLTDELLFI